MTTTESGRGSYLMQGWLVIVLAAMCGGSLAAIELWLKPKIENNKQQETLARIPALVPGAVSEDGVAFPTANGVVYRAQNGSEVLGWVLLGKGNGFADNLEILIGVDRDNQRVLGMYVLAQKETPGLGDFIQTDPAFAQQFQGLQAPIGVHKAPATGNTIQALTGATISSQSVADIVNATVAGFDPQSLPQTPGVP